MAKSKMSKKKVKLEVARLLDEIKTVGRKAREAGLEVTSLSKDELERKVRGETSNSPFMFTQSWFRFGSPGDVLPYTVYVSNPDPKPYHNFFCHDFFRARQLLRRRAGVGRARQAPDRR